jgi:hypothetical protein
MEINRAADWPATVRILTQHNKARGRLTLSRKNWRIRGGMTEHPILGDPYGAMGNRILLYSGAFAAKSSFL